MALVPRSFQTRIERRLALLFLGFCVAPLVVLTTLSARAIEDQTLAVAQRHLGQHAKSYAMHLVERLEVAAWELARGPGQGERTRRWVEPGAVVALPPGLERPVLRAREKGFEIGVPSAGRLVHGFLSDDTLFANLDHAPYGVRSCVRVGERVRRCAGPESSGPLVHASWRLGLASLYDTDVVIEVAIDQPREVVLSKLGVLHQVLPYVVFAVMFMGGWWVIGRLRTRFAPVADLQRATERVQAGDYTSSVEIRTGDELEVLGEAFNAMTRRLQESFHTMRTLSDMDHMVLNGAQLEDLVRQALLLMEALSMASGLVWIWDRESGVSELYRLADGRVERRTLTMPESPPDTTDAALATLGARWPAAVGPCAPVRRDGELSGLIACADNGCGASPGGTLAELGDRISVAVTLYNRARALFRQAHYDGLTGLVNREAFNERLSHASRSGAREGSRGALIYLDLDRFKQVNDTDGHHIGDRLLTCVADRLRHAVRATDEVARLGGDEFAVLIPHIELTAEIDVLCRRVIEEINRPVEIEGHAYVTEVSMGVVVFPDDGEDGPSLLRKAEVAMYKAKEQSGCAFTFFDAGMNRQTEHRAHVEGQLRRGLEARELCLHFQPKVRLRDGKVVGVEGLLRWPAARNMSPGTFIPVAEQTGLIHSFTRVLVEDGKACLERCRAAGFDLERVGVNVSPRQFQRGGFAEEFLELLHACGAAPSDFEIEVTESVFVHDAEAVARDLELLRGAGVTIALDDFGTGYSSLNVLRELPLDVIKIDRSFVTPISDSSQARDLIGRIIDIVRSLNLTSVAEGVETEREMQVLLAKQCDIVQGFLFSPALPVPALLQFLQGRSRAALSA